MRLFIHHRTEYSFSEPQARVVQLLRLTPGSHEGQSVVAWRIDVDRDARLKRGRDGYGNEITMLYIDGPLDRIGLSVEGEVLTDDRAGVVTSAPEPLPPFYFTQTTPLTRPSAEIAAFAEDIRAAGGSALDQVHRLNTALYERLRFGPPHFNADRTAAAAFEEGHGVCQDFAHVFIAAARLFGIPARYVSGHLYREDAEGRDQQGAHGWAEAHIENYGWIGFDPANDICPDEAYVRVAVGLDHREAAPISGTRIGGGHELLEVGVRVGLSQSQTQG